jgi:hypothetical protein
MRATPKKQPQNAKMSGDTYQRCLEQRKSSRRSGGIPTTIATTCSPNVIGIDDDLGYVSCG